MAADDGASGRAAGEIWPRRRSAPGQLRFVAGKLRDGTLPAEEAAVLLEVLASGMEEGSGGADGA